MDPNISHGSVPMGTDISSTELDFVFCDDKGTRILRSATFQIPDVCIPRLARQPSNKVKERVQVELERETKKIAEETQRKELLLKLQESNKVQENELGRLQESVQVAQKSLEAERERYAKELEELQNRFKTTIEQEVTMSKIRYAELIAEKEKAHEEEEQRVARLEEQYHRERAAFEAEKNRFSKVEKEQIDALTQLRAAQKHELDQQQQRLQDEKSKLRTEELKFHELSSSVQQKDVEWKQLLDAERLKLENVLKEKESLASQVTELKNTKFSNEKSLQTDSECGTQTHQSYVHQFGVVSDNPLSDRPMHHGTSSGSNFYPITMSDDLITSSILSNSLARQLQEASLTPPSLSGTLGTPKRPLRHENNFVQTSTPSSLKNGFDEGFSRLSSDSSVGHPLSSREKSLPPPFHQSGTRSTGIDTDGLGDEHGSNVFVDVSDWRKTNSSLLYGRKKPNKLKNTLAAFTQ